MCTYESVYVYTLVGQTSHLCTHEVHTTRYTPVLFIAQLIPNHGLRATIEEFFANNGESGLSP